MYNVGALLGGIANDKLGFFYGQIVSVIPNIFGFVLFAFIEDNEQLIWAAWPLACLGMPGPHFMNMQFCRLGRQYYTSTVAFMGACNIAAASMTLLMEVMHNEGLSYKEIFFIWAVARLAIVTIRLIFLTPTSIPASVESEYSVFDNRYLRCGKQVEVDEIEKKTVTDTNNEETFKVVLTNYRFYVSVGAIAIYALRASTFVSWLGAGWPEWVAHGFMDDNYIEFSQQINSFMSIGNLAVIFINMLSGAIVDICRKRSHDDRIGSANGLMVCYFLVAVFSMLISLFSSFQEEWTAYAAVVSCLMGRGFSSLWGPMIQLLFPLKFFGATFGIICLVQIPTNMLSVPMLAYNKKHDEFATMSYVFIGMTTVVFLLPFIMWAFKRQVQNELSNENAETSSVPKTSSNEEKTQL